MQNIVNGAIHLFSIFYFFIFISIFSIYSSVYWHSNYIQKICDSEILKAHIKLFDGYISKTHFYLIATCDTFLYLILLFKLVTTCQSAVPSMPQCAKVCQSPPSAPKCQSPPSGGLYTPPWILLDSNGSLVRLSESSVNWPCMVRFGSGSALLVPNLNLNLGFRFGLGPNPNLKTLNLRFGSSSGLNWNFIHKITY